MTEDEYADVRTLLRERSASPQHRVDVDEVIRRGRRSRRIRRADQALAVSAVLAVVVGVGVLVSRPQGSTPPTGPTPTASRISPTPFGSTVYPLPTSGWTPGSAARQALLSGTVVLDGHGCVVVDAGRGALTAVVWPRGTTARRSAAGAVQILAPDGSVAATTGDRIAVGGGGLGTADPDPCVAAYDNVFVVMQPPPYAAHRDTPKVILAAVANARRYGSVVGTVEWVETTWRGIAAHISASSDDPRVPMYVIQTRGHFVLGPLAPGPGGEPLTGTVLVQCVPVAGADRGPGSYWVSDAVIDISVLGPVHVLEP
jgi:hypothetical protein